MTREIEACKAFRSSHESLGLAIEHSFGEGEEATHGEMLEKLTFELNERKRLRTHINDMKQKKILLQKSIHEKSSFLSGLQGQVASIHRACKPVQKHIPPVRLPLPTTYLPPRQPHHSRTNTHSLSYPLSHSSPSSTVSLSLSLSLSVALSLSLSLSGGLLLSLSL